MLTIHKEVALGGCCRGNKGSGTEISSNRIGLQPRGHAPSRFPVKKLRCLLHKRRKVTGICMRK